MSINKTALSVAIMLSCTTAFAAEQQIDVESFSGVSIGTGMISKVTCGSSNTVTLRGKKKVLDNVEVEIKRDVLDISRGNSAGSLFGKLMSNNNDNGGRVEVDIVTTDGTLSMVDASTGAIIAVDACATNTSTLSIDASTGSQVNIDGITSELTLDMSTGSIFNNRADAFMVDTVRFDLSTGATANLCGATNAQGDASTGATIYLQSSVDTTNIDKSIGATTSSGRCK